MKFNDKEDIIQLTPLWQGERFEDGRPSVAGDILRRMSCVVTEEAWGASGPRATSASGRATGSDLLPLAVSW